jgi:hypothetical protein
MLDLYELSMSSMVDRALDTTDPKVLELIHTVGPASLSLALHAALVRQMLDTGRLVLAPRSEERLKPKALEHRTGRHIDEWPVTALTIVRGAVKGVVASRNAGQTTRFTLLDENENTDGSMHLARDGDLEVVASRLATVVFRSDREHEFAPVTPDCIFISTSFTAT